MGMIQEFKAFALKGNVVDMAVGVVIGGAFGKVISSLVGDVIMPLVSSLSGGDAFTNKYIWLGEGEKPALLADALKTGQPLIGWGSLLQTLIDFLIIAVAIFMAVKVMTSMQKKEEEAPKTPSEDIQLLREIRDGLAK